ncbi:MAG TPA: hypothetical protein VKA45_11600 [Gaiellaceae bacterium]|nr:hypothetical protein [Gaiellaceae bacterium]
MKKTTALLACALAALLTATAASAEIAVGVSDDLPIAAPAVAADFYAAMQDVGLRENRIAVKWDSNAPTAVPNEAGIERALAEAGPRGVNVVLSLYPLRPRALTDAPAAPAQFAAWTAIVARRFPSVRDFIVGNEPNVNNFWQPQYGPKAKAISCATYAGVLAASFDALKRVNPAIDVIGVGLSPRGNDNPGARSNPSVSPVRCIRDMGAAYKASKRTRPLMDELSFHPFPNLSTDPLGRGYQWPNAGLANLDRIKQAVWDAFYATGQPVFPESSFGRFGSLSAIAAADSLRFRLNEVGWQVEIVPSARGAYFGRENVATTDETSQAEIYSQAIPFIACDPAVRSLLFFHLIDDPNLDRWQSGMIRADGTKRPSYESVKAAIARTGGRCGGFTTAWRHATSVIGPTAKFPFKRAVRDRTKIWTMVATAFEAANYNAGVFRVSRRATPTGAARRKIERALLRAKPRGAALAKAGKVSAYREAVIRFPGRRLKPGFYVYAVELFAETNPTRKSFFVSKPFRVVAPKGRR